MDIGVGVGVDESSLSPTCLTLRSIAIECKTFIDVIKLCQKLELIPIISPTCGKCCCEMKIAAIKNEDILSISNAYYRCNKQKCKGYSKSIFHGTIFSRCKIPTSNHLMLIYAYCGRYKPNAAASLCDINSRQVYKRFATFRNYQAKILNHFKINSTDFSHGHEMLPIDFKYKIGGSGHVVEVSLFKLYRPKYHKGRSPKLNITLILGIDRTTKHVFCKRVNKEVKCINSEICLFVKENILPHTSVIIENRRNIANALSESKLLIKKLNLCLKFGHKRTKTTKTDKQSSSQDPDINLQMVCRCFRSVKNYIPKEIAGEMKISSYINSFIYENRFNWNILTNYERFVLFCKHVSYLKF
jgi:hypothetical protein